MNQASLVPSGHIETEGSASSAPSPPIASKQNLPLLDAFRGFSALGVLVNHIHTPGVKVPSGAVFVDIFMAISGFLMTHHYILREEKEPWGSRMTMQKFYLRRFFRIAPLYYCCLLFFFLIWLGQFRLQEYPVTWSVIQHFTFLFGFLPNPAWTGMPDWSISLEMQFYLVFPFLMLWVRRSGPVPLLLLAAAISFVANRLVGVYNTEAPGLLGLYSQPSVLPLKFTLFTFGMLTAYLYWKRVKLQWHFIGFLAIASALPYKHGHSWFVLLVLGSVLLASQTPTIGDHVQSWVSRLNDFCKNRIFHLLAEYSFAVYLTHEFVCAFVVNRFGTVLMDRGPVYHWYFVLAMTLLLVYPLAFLLQHFIEKPGIALGRYLCTRYSEPKRIAKDAPARD